MLVVSRAEISTANPTPTETTAPVLSVYLDTKCLKVTLPPLPPTWTESAKRLETVVSSKTVEAARAESEVAAPAFEGLAEKAKVLGAWAVAVALLCVRERDEGENRRGTANV